MLSEVGHLLASALCIDNHALAKQSDNVIWNLLDAMRRGRKKHK